jgi:predicted MPP superfamily phosphohydrolase
MFDLTSAEPPEPTIVLMHDPAAFEPERLRGTKNLLLLAGHLHGGQITLWRDRRGRPQPAASCYKWLVDRATIGTATLIVSRGLGETLPLRIQAPQEIVMVDFWT